MKFDCQHDVTDDVITLEQSDVVFSLNVDCVTEDGDLVTGILTNLILLLLVSHIDLAENAGRNETDEIFSVRLL